MSASYTDIVPSATLNVVMERSEDGRAILRHQDFHSYTEVSEAVGKVWCLCDGQRSIAEIVEAVAQMGAPDADEVTQIALTLLVRDGLVVLGQEVCDRATAAPVGGRFGVWLKNILTTTVRYEAADLFITKCYEQGCWRLFTSYGLSGASFFVVASLLIIPLHVRSYPPIFLGDHIGFILAFEIGTLFLHEMAHALTVKHYGKRVLSMGIGWFWFGPIAFVNTSDIWLCGRLRRICVSLAGPAFDLAVAGALCSVAFLAPPDIAALAVTLAGAQWLKVAYNLAPFLEYDGYYVLCDLLGRPHLRRDGFTWLLRIAGRQANFLSRRYFIEIAYAGGSLVYIGLLLILQIRVVFFTLQQLFHLDPYSGAATALVLASLVVAGGCIALGIYADVKNLIRDKPEGVKLFPQDLAREIDAG